MKPLWKGTFHKPALSAEDVGDKRLFRIEPHDLLFSIPSKVTREQFSDGSAVVTYEDGIFYIQFGESEK